ncbi:MAG: hypothetical protein ABR575_01465 [Actinomycetota bacterium]
MTWGPRVALAASALALAAGAPHVGATARQDARAAIQALVERRADALMQRDRAAFLATVSPSSPAFLRRQEKLFDWIADVPLASYELTVRWDRVGDLARQQDRVRYPSASDVAIPLTEERYRIEGYDERPAIEDMYFTFVKEEGRWKVAGDSDLDDLALYSGRHLWDFGPVIAQTEGRFLLLSHPCGYDGVGPNRAGPCVRLNPEILEFAGRELDLVERYWKAPWEGEVVVVAPATEGELRRMLQATFDLGKFVAFAYATVDANRGLDFTGNRIVLNSAALSGRSSPTTSRVLAHELLHIVTRRASGPFVPVFVEEGFAEYVSYDGSPWLSFLRGEVAAGRFDGRLPRDFEFLTGGGTEIYRSYQEAQSAVVYFIDRWGLERFARFYRILGSTGAAAGSTRFHVDRALRRATGESYKTFQEGWASSLTG